MYPLNPFLFAIALTVGLATGITLTAQTVTVTHSKIEGIGAEAGVMRRDPSDVIKVGDLFYVWYSKGLSLIHI